MKQLIILLLFIIVVLLGFGKYNEYKRFNVDAISYKTPENIDLNYHNKTTVFNYLEAVEDLNSFTTLQWTANDIDVRKPEEDDEQSIAAVKIYAKRLAKVIYYEKILQNSFQLKKNGTPNNEIKSIELTGKTIKELQQEEYNTKYKDHVISLFNRSLKVNYGQRSALIFETQKLLVKSGLNIKIDGFHRKETSNAIKSFELKNNLYPDGKLDFLTVETLLESQ